MRLLRRFAAVVTCLAMLAPGVAFAAQGDDNIPVSGVLIGAVSIAVSALLALLAWSLKNNVEGFKSATVLAQGEAQRAKDKAEACMTEISKVRIDLASAITRADLQTMTQALERMQNNLHDLHIQVAGLAAAQRKQENS